MDRKSIYTGVHYQRNKCRGQNSRHGWYKATITRDGKRLLNKLYENDRDAAKAVDLALLKAGYPQINNLYKRI